MKREKITTVTSEQVKKIKDRTRDDAPEGPPLPAEFWKDAKVVYPNSKSSELLGIDIDGELKSYPSFQIRQNHG